MKEEKYIALCLPGHPRRREIRKLVQGRTGGWGAVEIEVYPGAEESFILAHPAGESMYISAAALRLLLLRGTIEP